MLCLSCRTFSRQPIMSWRSLVCGSGEELAEDPLTLSAMKSPAYAPDLLLENCDQMVLCTANHTQTGFSI